MVVFLVGVWSGKTKGDKEIGCAVKNVAGPILGQHRAQGLDHPCAVVGQRQQGVGPVGEHHDRIGAKWPVLFAVIRNIRVYVRGSVLSVLPCPGRMGD